MATPGKHLTERERERIRKMASQNIPRADIARALKLSHSCVGKILRKSN